mmetsp:Transcript_40100/g.123888  ORF Transcript_40100/g.123888 Transcript_40100/m.123888 type:complete len:654 (-) Transcript_40100:17-1978(-)
MVGAPARASLRTRAQGTANRNAPLKRERCVPARAAALLREGGEEGDDLLVLLAVVGDVGRLALAGLAELHLLQHDLGARDLLLDERPRDRGVTRGLGDGLLRLLVEGDDVAEHPHGLVQRAVLVVLGEGVLLEELLADHLGGLEDDLVRLGQRVLADELHDLLQLLLALEDLGDDGAQAEVLGVELAEVRLEALEVLGVRDEPVDGREVLTLREALLEAPEDLDDGERGGRDGVGEVTTRGRHGADDGDGTAAARRAEARDAAGALVEGGEAGTEVGGVATVGGHLGETAGDLTEGLGPAGGGVGHHGDVLAHITVVLGEGDAGVDGRLTRGDGHVGRVRDEARALHDRLLAAVDDGGELGEVHEHLGHLVAALAAADVNDTVGVGELGEGLGDDGLAAAEGTRDGARAALDGREEGVEDALAGEQRVVARLLLGDGARRADGPAVHQLDLLLLAVELDLHDVILERVVARLRDVRDAALHARRQHDGVVVQQGVLGDVTEDVAAGDHVADAHLGLEVPLLLAVERGHLDALGDEDVLDHAEDGVERALDAVEDLAHDARAELERERLAGAVDGVAHGEAAGLLVHLDRGGVALKADDLADEAERADLHQLVHGSAGHAVGDDDGAGHGLDGALHALLLEGLLTAAHGRFFSQ